MWDGLVYTLWLPFTASVAHLHEGPLVALSEANVVGSDHIVFAATAVRIASLLADPNVLLAPIGAPVIPLPHQVRALARVAANTWRVRYLLADEVGLGKTIEAGLILRELKLRGLVQRVLIVTPKSLATQWVTEMNTHFGEAFRLITPGESITHRAFGLDDNLWQRANQVVCPMDSVKPLESRRGWSKQQVDDYNRARFEDLVLAGWDLVIVDEAHRLAGSTSEIARYKLGQGLADAAPCLLLLSATPHQGKTDAFQRLLGLLDAKAFPTAENLQKDRIQRYVIRTEKRQAIDAEGQPLFKPRTTRLVAVAWEPRHRLQEVLYESVTDYVRDGYNRALREKKNTTAFLMLLMQRLVASSTRAIRTALERRLEVLREPEARLGTSVQLPIDEWAELDGQEQLDAVVTLAAALRNEQTEVERLLDLARASEAGFVDAKTEALLDLIYQLQQIEHDPQLKLLIFTEFVPTQEMLRAFLQDRGVSVVCLNGSMDLASRTEVQREFKGDKRILISTEAGGEGLNLQFCHIVVNYDLPWNPMRLEQRIGRVDRIGQTHPVSAFNYVLEGSVDHRVCEVLEEKLARILTDFGVDKTGDVLDSVDADQLFDRLYVEALLDPASLQASATSLEKRLQEQSSSAREGTALYTVEGALDPSAAEELSGHPLPHWIERMTVAYVRSQGGRAIQDGGTWTINWPNGEITNRVIFSVNGDGLSQPVTQLTLGDARVRKLLTRMVPHAEGQPIPRVSLPGTPMDVRGFWSIWRIELAPDAVSEGQSDQTRSIPLSRRFVPLFLHDDGRDLAPTARVMWERMMTEDVLPHGVIDGSEAGVQWRRIHASAQAQAATAYAELRRTHEQLIASERERGAFAFAARRRVIDQLGLAEVRAHRREMLATEERDWDVWIDRSSRAIADFAPLLILRVEAEAEHAGLA